MTSRMLLAATVIVSALSATGARADVFSERSGNTGSVKAIGRLPGDTFMYELTSSEQSDRPCYVMALGTNGHGQQYAGHINKCRKRSWPGGSGTARIGGVDSMTYVTGLKVCLSKSGRVKGWTIYGKAEGGGMMSDTFKRPNCYRWKKRVTCPSGTKGRGVRAHFEPGTGRKPDILVGMQLVCK